MNIDIPNYSIDAAYEKMERDLAFSMMTQWSIGYPDQSKIDAVINGMSNTALIAALIKAQNDIT